MDDHTPVHNVRAAYDAVAVDYAARFPGTEAEQPIDLAMIDHLVSVLPGSGSDVLDAGCGTGRIARYLTDRGCRVQGIDLSPGMIAMARRDHADIRVRVGSIAALPFPDATFDAVIFWYSIIHTTDTELPGVFREARRVLRPGGSVLVAWQAGEGSRDLSAHYRSLGHDVTLIRFDWTADQISGLLAAAQFAEHARMVRRPVTEKSDQAVLIARAR